MFGSEMIDTPIKYKKREYTPLHVSAFCNNLDCVKTLLYYGSKSLNRLCYGKTCLDMILCNNKFINSRDNMVNTLLALGAVCHKERQFAQETGLKTNMFEQQVAELRYEYFFSRSLSDTLLQHIRVSTPE
jgi:hypothetical protein